jgi:hypothetical protein
MAEYLNQYARDLKRKKEDIERNLTRKIEDYGFEEGTRDFDTAKNQVKRSVDPAFGDYRSPDVPKLVSLRAAKDNNSTPQYGQIPSLDETPKRDFSKMQFLDDGLKKGGKINLKDCKVTTHVPSKKHGDW